MNSSHPEAILEPPQSKRESAVPKSTPASLQLPDVLEKAPLEVRILTLCAKSRLSDSDKLLVKACPFEKVDWPLLLELSRYHRVTALLFNALQTCGIEIPDGYADILRNYVQRAHAWSMFLSQEMVGVLKELKSAGINALPFKGPVISWSAYRNPGLRPFTDIDLLIEKQSMDGLTEVLKKRGYAAHGYYRERLKADRHAQLWLTRQRQFVKGYAVFNLDVHVDIVSPLYTFGIRFEDLWRRSQPLLLNGYEARRFSEEDMLVILCYQGIKDRWERLKYVCDVAEHIAASPNLDWDVVENLARQSGSHRLLSIGLQLAYELLGANVPEVWIERYRKDPQTQYLAGYATEKILHQYAFRIPSLQDRFWFHLRAQQHLVSKFRYCTFSLLRNAYDVIAPRPRWS